MTRSGNLVLLALLALLACLQLACSRSGTSVVALSDDLERGALAAGAAGTDDIDGAAAGRELLTNNHHRGKWRKYGCTCNRGHSGRHCRRRCRRAHKKAKKDKKDKKDKKKNKNGSCKVPAEKCSQDSQCCSNVCDSGTHRCNWPCDPSLKQKLVDGKCGCQEGYLDVNRGDGTFCAEECALSGKECAVDSDCCDHELNMHCVAHKCQVKEDGPQCGSNQEKIDDTCKCVKGFINVASNGMGIEAPDPFCVPSCTVRGNACDAHTNCCDHFGRAGYCHTVHGESHGICGLKDTGDSNDNDVHGMPEETVY